MERWRGRVALVTGAAGGVGGAVARALVKYGMNVVACDINASGLQTLVDEVSDGPGKVMIVPCDLAEEAQIMHMFYKVQSEWGGVDVCCNCAAMTTGHFIINGNSKEWNTMIGVNFLAPCICIRESVKSMKARGVDDGQIININSNSGHRVGRMHFYSATKYALTALTDAIRWEMLETKSHIRVAQISPKAIKSDFHYNYLSKEEVHKLFTEKTLLSPEDIAEQVIFILSRPRHVQVHEVQVEPVGTAP